MLINNINNVNIHWFQAQIMDERDQIKIDETALK